MKHLISFLILTLLCAGIPQSNGEQPMKNTAPARVTVDFTKKLGRIKPMNAGNNGPNITKGENDQPGGNFDTFKMLHIPYARLHDSNHTYGYGAPHTVDVRAIFKDFNADPNDPASYDFVMTDLYLKTIERAGTEPFFRLGGGIEHYPRKWFTCVPPDFQKFAVVCEHIIRHCTGTWANGLNMKITYWEIWNEPDIDPDDALNKRCWQGTAEEFRQMFCITAKHLKACFPELKIGGPAACHGGGLWRDKLFAEMEKQQIKLDFYSWHRYASDVTRIFSEAKATREYLDTHGQPQAESILDEWNYVKNFHDDWIYSLEQEAGMKGAAFALCTMLGCQKLPLDMLMYYDMRIDCGMNGLWRPVTFDLQKTYYSYFMFDKLARLGTEVESESSDAAVQVVGAIGAEGGKAVVIGSFSDDDNCGSKDIEIVFKGLSAAEKAKATVRLLDEKTDCFDVPFDWKDDTITFPFRFRPCSGILIQF